MCVQNMLWKYSSYSTHNCSKESQIKVTSLLSLKFENRFIVMASVAIYLVNSGYPTLNGIKYHTSNPKYVILVTYLQTS